MTSLWTIRLLGGFTAQRADREVFRFQNRKTGSLLAQLAYHLTESHSRDTIVELLWPEKDVYKGRHSLSQSLLSLRHQLEPPDIEPNSVLQADNARIRLNPKAVKTDLQRFRLAASKAELAVTIEERIVLLRNAVGLYGGELLPGFFDDWILVEREQVTSLFLRVVRSLMTDLKEQGLAEEALDYALKAAALSPDSDKMHSEVIGLQFSLGLHDEAVIHYRDYRNELRREYDRLPGPTLQELMVPYADRLTGCPSHRHKSKIALSKRAGTLVAELALDIGELGAAFPTPFNRFFGRETELAQISRFVTPEAYSGGDSIAQAPSRLLTVVGMGGCGKTRLVLHACHRLGPVFSGRILFVPLGDVTHADNVAHAILSALAEQPTSAPAAERVRSALKNGVWLVVLDNCEHLMPNVGLKVRCLLEDLPDLRIVATSRMPLGLNGEHVLPLMPFEVPFSANSPRALFEFPCVQMFVDRAQAVNPDFQLTRRNAGAIAAIAERLEGIPLAIELAATHAHALTPAQILVALADRFKLLVTRQIRDRRHRALVDTIDWSFALLPQDVRGFLDSLPVFCGSFTVEAAGAVTGHENPLQILEDLLDRSLVVARDSGEIRRFSVLESLREYAATHADQETLLAASHKHADYYLRWATETSPGNTANERRAWMHVMDQEHNNLLAAIDRVKGTYDELRFTASLWRYWELRGHIESGIRLIERSLLVDVGPIPERAAAFHGLGALRERMDDVNGAHEAFEQSLEIFKEHSDPRGHAHVLNNLALLLEKQGDLNAANEVALKCLEMTRPTGNSRDIAACLNTLGRQRWFVGDREGAQVFLQEALQLYETIKDWDCAAAILNNIGCIAGGLGDLANARAAFERSLSLFRDLDQPAWTAFALHNLGDIKSRQGDSSGSQPALFEALEIRMKLSDHSGIAMTLETLAMIAHDTEDTVRAVHIVAAASALRLKYETPVTPASLPELENQISLYKAALNKTDFDAAWSFGSAMTMENAVGYVRDGRLIPRRTPEFEATDDPALG